MGGQLSLSCGGCVRAPVVESSVEAVLVSVRNTFTLRVTDGIGVARTAPVRGGSHLRSAGGAQAQ